MLTLFTSGNPVAKRVSHRGGPARSPFHIAAGLSIPYVNDVHIAASRAYDDVNKVHIVGIRAPQC
jgi:hypothetical protein